VVATGQMSFPIDFFTGVISLVWLVWLWRKLGKRTPLTTEDRVIKYLSLFFTAGLFFLAFLSFKSSPVAFAIPYSFALILIFAFGVVALVSFLAGRWSSSVPYLLVRYIPRLGRKTGNYWLKKGQYENLIFVTAQSVTHVPNDTALLFVLLVDSKVCFALQMQKVIAQLFMGGNVRQTKTVEREASHVISPMATQITDQLGDVERLGSTHVSLTFTMSSDVLRLEQANRWRMIGRIFFVCGLGNLEKQFDVEFTFDPQELADMRKQFTSSTTS
jgi:hypothetical protein